MDFRWRQTGFALESAPFRWAGSAQGLLVINHLSARSDAHCTLSLYTADAPEGSVWSLRMSAKPHVGTTALVTDVAPGTWVRFRWDFAGGPLRLPEILIL